MPCYGGGGSGGEGRGVFFFFTWRKLVSLIRSGWPPNNPFDITWQWGVMKWLFLIQPGNACKNHSDKDWYWSKKKTPLYSAQLTTWCIWFPQTKGWRQKGTEAVWTQLLPLNLYRLLLEVIAVLPFHPLFTSSFNWSSRVSGISMQQIISWYIPVLFALTTLRFVNWIVAL